MLIDLYMDWLVLLWILFALVAYIGGYLFPGTIGVYTSNLAAVYAAVLIVSAAAWMLRLRSGSETAMPSAPKTRSNRR